MLHRLHWTSHTGQHQRRIGTCNHTTAQADVTLDKSDGGFAITAVHLTLKARIPGADRTAFENAVETAKNGCPVSKVLNAEITLEAVLDN